MREDYSHCWRRRAQARDFVALAEFALTAGGFEFQGKKGENAPKLRKELADAARLFLRPPLADRLTASANNALITARPITETMKDRWQPNGALQANVPLPDDAFVRIVEATPEQAFASLDLFGTGWRRTSRNELSPVAWPITSALRA